MEHFSETHGDWDNVHAPPSGINGPLESLSSSLGYEFPLFLMLSLGTVVGRI